jgi:hypothetical protein
VQNDRGPAQPAGCLERGLAGTYTAHWAVEKGHSMQIPRIDCLIDRLEPVAALTALAAAPASVILALRRASDRNLRIPAIIGTVLVLPFMILEFLNRRAFHEDFPFPLFAVLWILPFAFTLLLVPILRSLRAHERSTGNPIILIMKAVFLILMAWLRISILQD